MKGNTCEILKYDDGTISKLFNGEYCEEFGLYYRELSALKRLENFYFTPNLRFYNEDSAHGCPFIRMTNCGELLTKHNAPKDILKQAFRIVGCLRVCDISHNDITPSNLVVNESGDITLIDFSWATELDTSIPKQWPKQLGGKFKKGVHDFDDMYSMNKSIEHILK